MTEKENFTIVFPEGRVIHSSLFEKDAFKAASGGKPGIPQYKIEVAYNPDDVAALEDQIVAGVVVAVWGDAAEKAYNDGVIRSCFLDGDKLAGKRELKGKNGDIYKGKLVVRASTQFNKHGQDGPGGVMVYDQKVHEIEPVDKHNIYSGCYGKMAVTVKTYDISGERGIKAYLNAFQKTREGEKIAGQADYSKVFAPLPSEDKAPARKRA